MTEIKVIGEEYLKIVFSLLEKGTTEFGEIFFNHGTEEMIAAYLQQGRSVGCFDGDYMVGVRLSYTEIIPSEYLEKLPIENNVSTVGAKFCGVYVNPNYRNRGLAKTMSVMVLNMLAKDGIRHIYATVHPENTPSLKVLQTNEFKIVYKGIFYNNKPRYLVYKYLL